MKIENSTCNCCGWCWPFTGTPSADCLWWTARTYYQRGRSTGVLCVKLHPNHAYRSSHSWWTRLFALFKKWKSFIVPSDLKTIWANYILARPRGIALSSDQQTLRAHQHHHYNQPEFLGMGQCVWWCQTPHRIIGSAYPSLPHHWDRQWQLPLMIVLGSNASKLFYCLELMIIYALWYFITVVLKR